MQRPVTKGQAPTHDASSWQAAWKARTLAVGSGIVSSAAGPGKRRRALILAILNAAIFFFAALPFVVVDTWAWLVEDAPHGAYNSLTSIVFCSAVGVTWAINRRGHVTPAAILHVTLMSVGLVAFFLHTDPQMMNILFVEPVIVAAFVLRPWASFPLAVVSAGSFAVLNELHGGTLAGDLQMSAGLLGVAIIAWVAASYLEWTAAALHTTEADLEQGRVVHRRAVEERRQVEAALAAAEQQSRTLFEKSPAGIMLFDRDLVITDCNERFAALVRASRHSLVGADYGRTGDQRARAAMEEALRGNAGSFEGSAQGQTGSREKWIGFTASPLLGSQNEVIGGIGVLNDLTDKKQGEEQVERLAFYDLLTGLANRRLLLDRVQQAIERSSRTGSTVTVAVFDIDHFRKVNDTIGPDAADGLLKAVTSRLEPIIRRGDTLARIGGDEFGLLISQADGFSAVVSLAERIQDAFRDPWRIGGEIIEATASLGFASYTDDTRDALNLLDNADMAMRRAKTLGRNTCQFFDPTMNVEVARRLAMEREFRVALSEERLCVYYQPQIDLRDGRITGAEALVRWPHPERGIVLPSEFVPLAEETGLIGRLDGWVVAEACREAVSWREICGRSLRLAVNVSPLHLHSPDLLPTVAGAVEASGLSAADLEIELTETAIVADAALATEILRKLRDLGVAVALDDFGTGYSSLSHLQELPITTVKVDRSFVSRMDSDAGAAAIVRAVTELAHSLGLGVVAEGVETDGQLRILQAVGCEIGQGFLFGQPLPAEEFRALLAAQSIYERVAPGLRPEEPAKLRVAGTVARRHGVPGYPASGSSR